LAKAHNNAVDKKTIAIFSKNVFYARYASAWLNLHGYNVKMLDMINDDLREQYKVLETQLWDDHEFKEWLNG